MTVDIAKSMNCGIYLILNKVNGKVYVGSANNIRRRFYLHRWELGRGDHHSTTLQRSWNKYGENSFEFKTLLVCDERDLFMYEQRAIDAIKSFDPAIGFNICRDVRGTRGVRWTQEQREKFIASKKGRQIYKNNPQAYANMMASVRRGDKHHMFGKKHTEESKIKMSVALSGRVAHNKGKPSPLKGIKRGQSGYKHTPEALAKIADASRNRSEETRAKLSKAARNCSEEKRAKLSASTAAYWKRKRLGL